MSMMKSLYNLFYKAVDKKQNEPKGVFSDVEVEVQKDVPYGDMDVCKVDVWTPKHRAEKLPVYFYIHGGSFVSGDKDSARGLSKWVAQMGYAVVTVRYGLAPEYKLFKQIKQIASALNWVESHADEYGFDLSRVVVGGDSAGGYHASLLTALTCDKELQKKFGVDVNLRFFAGVFNCALYSFDQMLEKGFTRTVVKLLVKDVLGIKFKEKDSIEPKEFWSVTNLVNKDFPRSFITYSKKDSVCPGQSEAFMQRLDSLGVSYESYFSTKLSDNHCFSLNWQSKASKENNELVKRFLTKIAQTTV